MSELKSFQNVRFSSAQTTGNPINPEDDRLEHAGSIIATAMVVGQSRYRTQAF
jgi:hypothetical protein